MLNKLIRYFLTNRLVTFLLLLIVVTWGLITSPFGWDMGKLPSSPVPVDAIPDIGENQQIVFTKWSGRSPQDIEDQITYPLTASLLGIPGVKSIRSSSIFGVSSIYIIFKDGIDFYWSRSRILEKLNSLPSDLLPNDVKPSLGPDATALGQVFWYTLEGRDEAGNPTGGWDLHEIRSIQDFFVKYGLNAVDGVSEVASIGGFVQEYQIDINPQALKSFNIPLHKVVLAVKKSNKDVGAKTIEINKAEYLVRGLGSIKSIKDIEEAVIVVYKNIPIKIKDIAVVSLGPADRRGLLDKGGAEVVGGVVAARYGANPLTVINNVKKKIKTLKDGLPKKTLANGKVSQLTIVPFYDRTTLINETLGTLEEALSLEILITLLIVIVMMFNLRASLLISSLLPLSVLIVFVAMRYFHVDANIVALSGIAIAIGTMVDLGIILSENISAHAKKAPKSQKLVDTIYNAASEVSSAILTAVSTTIISFIPVFTMQAAEGKLFRPLAYTKSFALIAALLVTLFLLPTLAYWVFSFKIKKNTKGYLFNGLLLIVGILASIWVSLFGGITLILLVCAWYIKIHTKKANWFTQNLNILISVNYVTWVLANKWMPLGVEVSLLVNFLFAFLLLGLILSFFALVYFKYEEILRWCLSFKKTFLAIPISLISFGVITWLGFNTVFGFIPSGLRHVNWDITNTKVWTSLSNTFPGIGKEFMPSLDEGSFLLMPTSMAHAGMEQNKLVLQQLDMITASIPEVDMVVGKMGRAETALDPAPISMYENIINYKPEYILNIKGHRDRFKTDGNSKFILVNGDTLSNQECLNKKILNTQLIKHSKGKYFRNWRSHIHSSNDIWNEIIKHIKLPGVTSAPKLQPIETRLIMLQTGMRAPMGIKVYGPDLKTIENFGLKLEQILKTVPSIRSDAVFADRIVGKPYIHLNINRLAIAKYGLHIDDVQQVIETAIGGLKTTTTIEGRKRFPVRVRYPRELRNNPSVLSEIIIPTPTGNQVPLGDLVDIEYVRGAQMIKSENTFLVGYVLLDKNEGFAEIEVVNHAKSKINEKIQTGELNVPSGVSFIFSGNYENQIRAEKRLSLVIPAVLFIIFIILYFQFKSISTSLMVFAGIAMAFSGAFIFLWFYGQGWFLNFSIFGANMRNLFQIHTVNLSVAVWVGFIALFGIATDDGVLIGTYLDQHFNKTKPNSISEIRRAVVKAGNKRILPAIMTSATTIIALLPVLTSTGRGADIMIPMAIPAFGGMVVASISYFITPVLYSMREEHKFNKKNNEK